MSERTLPELLDALIWSTKVSTMSTGWDRALQWRQWEAKKQIPILRSEIIDRFDATARPHQADPQEAM